MTTNLILKTLVICCLGSTALSYSHHSRRETISVRIIAYQSSFSSLACLNGNWYSSMIIRVDRKKHTSPEFIRVPFSLPCNEGLDRMRSSPTIRKFRLSRDKSCDSALEEFMSL